MAFASWAPLWPTSTSFRAKSSLTAKHAYYLRAAGARIPGTELAINVGVPITNKETMIQIGLMHLQGDGTVSEQLPGAFLSVKFGTGRNCSRSGHSLITMCSFYDQCVERGKRALDQGWLVKDDVESSGNSKHTTLAACLTETEPFVFIGLPSLVLMQAIERSIEVGL